jgi:hypothetical protein
MWTDNPWPPAPCKIQQQSISLINLALALDAAASVVLQKALTNFTCTFRLRSLIIYYKALGIK